MNKNTIMVIDIETLPDLDAIKITLLDHKVRNTLTAEEKTQKKLQYSFHEPQYSKAVCISTMYDSGMGNPPVRKTFFSRNNEFEILEQFAKYISKFNGIFVHFNGLDFDVSYLLYKFAKHNIPVSQRFCNLMRFRTNPHYDLMQVLTAWGKFKINLAEVCNDFGITNPKDIIPNLDTLSFLSTASDDDIIRYCEADVESTYELFTRVYTIFQ